ncbi:hypothetical protein Tco_0972897 [Tanacetum coccineum]
MKEQAYNKDKDQDKDSRTQQQSNLHKSKEERFKDLASGEIVSLKILSTLDQYHQDQGYAYDATLHSHRPGTHPTTRNTPHGRHAEPRARKEELALPNSASHNNSPGDGVQYVMPN